MSAFVPASGRGLPAYSGLRRAGAPLCTRPGPARAVVARTTPSAKLFAWKERADENYDKLEGDGVFTMDNLRPAPGSNKRKKRKGRGHAAGQGGSCGFGMRGQKSRSGRGTRPGFEGGQTPLYRRIPKFVGRPMGPGHTRKEYALMKIEHLNTCEDGATINMAALQEVGVTTKQKRKLVKVVAGEELTVSNLTVRAHKFTATAAAAIQGKGGSCITISPTTGKDLLVDGVDPSATDSEDSEAEVEQS